MANDTYATTVAERLIEQLQQGTAPWQKPWAPGQRSLPHNPTTGNDYRGFNTVWLAAQGYADPRWMTYKQAGEAGAQVRKGEKGTRIEYWKLYDDLPAKDAKGEPILDGDGKAKTVRVKLDRPRVFGAIVFNAEQIDGLPPAEARPVAPEPERHARADAIFAASGVPVQHVNGNRAYYSPATDTITMPEASQFHTADGYYATKLHELGHATGHASRLNRDLANPFGSEKYAREELRAEIASLMLGDQLGIGHDPGQHAAYVGSWIKVLRDDPREIFRAAADAEKIMAYVMGLENEQMKENQQDQDRRTQIEDELRVLGYQIESDPHAMPGEGHTLTTVATGRLIEDGNAPEHVLELAKEWSDLTDAASDVLAEASQAVINNAAHARRERVVRGVVADEVRALDPTHPVAATWAQLRDDAFALRLVPTIEPHQGETAEGAALGAIYRVTYALPEGRDTGLETYIGANGHATTLADEELAHEGPASLRDTALSAGWTDAQLERYGYAMHDQAEAEAHFDRGADNGEFAMYGFDDDGKPRRITTHAELATYPAERILAVMPLSEAAALDAQPAALRRLTIDMVSEPWPDADAVHRAGEAIELAGGHFQRGDYTRGLAVLRMMSAEERAYGPPFPFREAADAIEKSQPITLQSLINSSELHNEVDRAAVAMHNPPGGGEWRVNDANELATVPMPTAAHPVMPWWADVNASVPAEVMADLERLEQFEEQLSYIAHRVREAENRIDLAKLSPAEAEAIGYNATLPTPEQAAGELASVETEYANAEKAFADWRRDKGVRLPGEQVAKAHERALAAAQGRDRDPEPATSPKVPPAPVPEEWRGEACRVFDEQMAASSGNPNYNRAQELSSALRQYEEMSFEPSAREQAILDARKPAMDEAAQWVRENVLLNPVVKERVYETVRDFGRDTGDPVADKARRDYLAEMEEKQQGKDRGPAQATAEVRAPVLHHAPENPTADRTYLAVPYAEKDAAKACGAKWDKDAKSWYAPEGVDLAVSGLAKWQTGGEGVIASQNVGDAKDEFARALREAGLVVENVVMDGSMQRVPVVGDKRGEKSGAYAGHLDAHPGGFIQNHKSGEVVHWKSSQVQGAIGAQDRAKLNAEAVKRRQERADAREESNEETALIAAALFDRCDQATPGNAYLAKKGVAAGAARVVPAAGTDVPEHVHIARNVAEAKKLRQDLDGTPGKVFLAGDLLVPAYDLDGKLWNLQSVNPHFKSFMKGGRKMGLHTIAGDQAGSFANSALARDPSLPLVLAEGKATGETLADALGHPVIVAFDSGNLAAVAKELRERFPERPMLIAGDNDHAKEREVDERGKPKQNVGRTKAEEAAKEVSGAALVPQFAPDEKGSDWNDYAALHGLAAVRGELAGGVAQAGVQIDAYTYQQKQQDEVHLPDSVSPTPAAVDGEFTVEVARTMDRLDRRATEAAARTRHSLEKQGKRKAADKGTDAPPAKGAGKRAARGTDAGY